MLRALDQVQEFPSNATLFQQLLTILFKLSATFFSRKTIFKRKYVNFRCIYFHLKMVVRPKHVADNFNKLVNNLKLVVCILLRVLGQVEAFRLTQHWFEYFI
jgi:hypothetical protein